MITGLSRVAQMEDAIAFHAGTTMRDGDIITSGGRGLCVTGLGEDLRSALDRAYSGVGNIDFEGAHYRKDIGRRGLLHLSPRGSLS